MQEMTFEVMESPIAPTMNKRQYFKSKALTRVGETRLNSYGSMMIVDEYISSTEVYVRFEQGYTVKCTWGQFVSGSVKNPFDKSVFGIGYLGAGKYSPSDEFGNSTPQYKTWISMLTRCNSKSFQDKQPTYRGCRVAPEWLCFQTFAQWYDKNFYQIEGQKMHLDKDILVKGNKLYSPDTCVFVPQLFNMMFVKRQNSRGSLPIGVKLNTNNTKKFEVQGRNNTGKRMYLGYYDTVEKAFEAYKVFKEQTIKDTAEEYKDRIPSNLYSAMLNYKVEITD